MYSKHLRFLLKIKGYCFPAVLYVVIILLFLIVHAYVYNCLLLILLFIDEKTLVEYPQIKDGTRLNLVVKQQPPIIETEELEEMITKHVREHYSTEDTVKVLKEFMKEFDRSITQFSLDDYERMAKSLLTNDEQQKSQ